MTSGAGWGSGSDAAVARANGEVSVRGQPGGPPPRPAPPAAEAVASEATPTFKLFPSSTEFKGPRVARKPPVANLIGSGPAEPQAPATEELVPEPDVPRLPAQTPQAVTVATAAATPPEQPPTTPAPASPVNGSPTPGAVQQPAADPARMADSESDPFSKLGTVTFTEGALEIRFGRKVKTRKPKLLIAGQIDLLSLQRAKVVLKIDIDETGKVTSVHVIKSSGSNEIDQPTRVAVYDWWFEPKKDPSGVAVADQVQFTIGWR